jgi:hypothetical protein
VPEGEKLDGLRAKYAPVIVALVEKLKEVPDQGHLLSPWRDDLRAKLLWVYARDYATVNLNARGSSLRHSHPFSHKFFHLLREEGLHKEPFTPLNLGLSSG